jgi:hypothetical protein
VVVDLSNGRTRTFDAGRPLAGMPDGRTLLTSQDNRLRRLSVDSGAVVDVGVDLGPNVKTSFAFSPDGGELAMQEDGGLHIVDLAAGAQHELVRLGGDRVLAGPGAWRADGTIAVSDTLNCRCGSGAIVHLRMSYVDSRTGDDASGPRLDGFDALGARLLGWRTNGDAVVVRYQPAGDSGLDADVMSPPGGRAELVGLSPGGGTRRLVSLPGGTNRVDVAAQLLDRFGGPAPSIGYRLGDWLRTQFDDLLCLLAVIAVVVVGIVWWRRRLRRRPQAAR